MELTLFNSVIFVFGFGFLIYRSVNFVIFILNSLPGEEDLKWRRSPNFPSIKSRKLRKKHLFDFLKTDRSDLDNSLKEQSFPMNSIEEDIDNDSNLIESIPEINIDDNIRPHRIPYQNTSSPKV